MAVPPEFGIDHAALQRIVVPNIPEKVRDAEMQIFEQIEKLGFNDDDAFAIKLALEEGLVNAIRHGNLNDPSKQIELHYSLSTTTLVFGICDEGIGFAPEEVPDPTLDENLEKPHGRGLMLMRAYMTEVRFNDRGNEVWMIKRLDEAADDEDE